MAHLKHSEVLRQRINSHLAGYSQEAASYRLSGRRRSLVQNVARGSLAAIVPLVASADVAQAQCRDAVGPGGMSVFSYSGYAIPFPIFSGIGHVVLIYARSGTGPGTARLDGGGTVGMEILLGTSPFAALLTGSDYVTGFMSPFGTRAILCDASDNGPFCPGHATPAYVGIRTAGPGGTPGWAALTITSKSTPRLEWILGQSGLDAGGDNSAHAGDCASLEALMPVELTSFVGTFHEQNVDLVWQTASELNNAGYELQRAEAGKVFRKIAYVEGSGTTNDPKTYNFTDTGVEANAQYRYRLKQIDYDGSYSFSQIIEVFTEDLSRVALSEVFPNPLSDGRAIIQINVAEPGYAEVDVFDIRGARVDSRLRILSAGQNRLAFETDNLAAGPHFARVRIGERVMYRQFVVTK